MSLNNAVASSSKHKDRNGKSKSKRKEHKSKHKHSKSSQPKVERANSQVEGPFEHRIQRMRLSVPPKYSADWLAGVKETLDGMLMR